MKANINGIVQDYKPRLDSEKPKSIPLKTAGECLSALKNYGDDEEIRDAATRKLWMMLKEQHEETRYWAHRKMNFEPTAAEKKEDEIFQTLFVDDEKNDSFSRLMERRRDVWGLDDSAQADEMPDGFTFIGTYSIEEQPDGRGVINLGSADDYDQEETDSQLKDSVSYSMRKEMYGERALYEMLGVVAELFEEMAAFCECVHSDTKTASHFNETAENCEIVRDVIANRNSRKR